MNIKIYSKVQMQKQLLSGFKEEIAVISLYPEDKEDPFFKSTISVDTKTYEPVGVSTHNKNGMISTINITKLKTNLNYKPDELDFDTNKYPKAMLIDLR